MEDELVEVLEVPPNQYADLDVAADFTCQDGTVIHKGTRLSDLFPDGILVPVGKL